MKAQCSVILHAHIYFIAAKFQVLCKLPGFSDAMSVPDLLILLFGQSPWFRLPSAPRAVVSELPPFHVHMLLLEQKA